MKLRDIVKLSAIMLNLDDVLSSEELYDASYDIDSEDEVLTDGDDIDKTFNLLIRCFNLAYSEIATDYVPLLDSCEIQVSGGEFDLTSLDNTFYKFIKLEDKLGREIKCNIYNNTLKAQDGTYNLIYCYVPEFCSLNDDVNNFNGKILDRVFAYGINKEYCYISGMYEEANSYKIKFEESLKACCQNKKSVILPRRRWV